MTRRILLVGYDPDTVDYSNPALPPGMSAERIRAGVSLSLREMTDRGWEGDVCYIRADGTAGQTVEHHLASGNYACVVIGAGVRLPPQSLAVFEAVVNAIHKAAPAAVIAFNTRPEDSADAAARWLSPDWGAKDRGEYRQAAGAIGQVLSGGAVTNGPEAYPRSISHKPKSITTAIAKIPTAVAMAKMFMASA